MPRRALCLLTAALAALAAESARAEERPATVRLEWVAEGGCTDAVKLRAQVEEALGRPAFSDTPDADLVLVGRATRTHGSFDAVVTLSRASGEVLGTRTLSSRSSKCDELSMGLPLALALMIDLPLREATVRVVLPVPAAPTAPPPPTAVPKPAAPPPPSRLHAAIVAGPVLRIGWIPDVAVGVRLATEVGVGPVPVGVEGTWVPPSSEDDGHVSARTWSLSGAIYGCPLSITWKRLYGGACAYVEGGAVVADGIRAIGPQTDLAWLLAAGGRLRGGLRWSPFVVGLELGGAGFLVPPRIAYGLAGGGDRTLAESWPGNLDIFLCAGMWLP